MKTKLPLFLLLMCATLSSLQAAQPDTSTVSQVDLPRYMGRWYVISHIPNFLEKHKVGTSDNYTLRLDGTISDIFVFRHGTLDAPEKQWRGHGWVVNRATNAEWKVRLFWPFIASYRVVELDPDYRWVAASTTSGKLLWIMARTPALDEGTYQQIVQRLSAKGFATRKLEKVLQASP
jgi:apolipoprotein D and lipocalin family protein